MTPPTTNLRPIHESYLTTLSRYRVRASTGMCLLTHYRTNHPREPFTLMHDRALTRSLKLHLPPHLNRSPRSRVRVSI